MTWSRSAAAVFSLLIAGVFLPVSDAAPSGQPGTIDSIAGGGLGDGGGPEQATFDNEPLVFGMDGDLYVPSSCVVQRVHHGVVSTVAGRIRTTYDPNDLCLPLSYAIGDQATAADLTIRGVAVDEAGVMYIDAREKILVVEDGAISREIDGRQPALTPDGTLHVVRDCAVYRVDANGDETRVAGVPFGCGYGGDGGDALDAYIRPDHIAFDHAGRLHVGGPCGVRRVENGIITTVAGAPVIGLYCPDFPGDGSATASGLAVRSIAFDGDGHLLIGGYCRIMRVREGAIETIAGIGVPEGNIGCPDGGDGGPALQATLFPDWLAVDETGRIFVSGDCARVIENGIIRRAGLGCGVGDGVHPRDAKVSRMYDVAVGPDDEVYVVANCRVRVIDSSTIRTVAGNGFCGSSDDSSAHASMDPKALALSPSGAIYIADHCRIRKLVGGTITTIAGTGEQVEPNEHCALGASDGPALQTRLWPYDIVIGSDGELYVSDMQNCRVVKIANDTITTVAGDGRALHGTPHTMSGCGYTGSSGDGSEPLHAHLSPAGLAIAPDGGLFVADVVNCSIRLVQNGSISTVAGGLVHETFQVGRPPNDAVECDPEAFVENGIASETALAPRWLALDPAGDLFIGEWAGRRSFGQCDIRKLVDGRITTVAGRANGDGCRTGRDYEDGDPALTVEFDIDGLALDSAGNLYFGDNRHDRVRIIYGVAAAAPTPSPTPTSGVVHSSTTEPTAVVTAVVTTTTPAQAVAGVATRAPDTGVLAQSVAPVKLPSTGTGQETTHLRLLAMWLACLVVSSAGAIITARRRMH